MLHDLCKNLVADQGQRQGDSLLTPWLLSQCTECRLGAGGQDILHEELRVQPAPKPPPCPPCWAPQKVQHGSPSPACCWSTGPGRGPACPAGSLQTGTHCALLCVLAAWNSSEAEDDKHCLTFNTHPRGFLWHPQSPRGGWQGAAVQDEP